MADNIKHIYFPTKEIIDSDDLRASLTFSLKIPNSSNMTDALSKIATIPTTTLNTITSYFGSDNEKRTLDLKTVLSDLSNISSKVTNISPFTSDTKFMIHTYIPGSIKIMVNGKWESTAVLGTDELIQVGLETVGKIDATGLSDVIIKHYDAIKSQASYLSGVGLDRREFQMFKPDFQKLSLKYMFIGSTKSECDDLEKIIKMFRESLIPERGATRDLYTYPSVYRISFNIKKGRASNKDKNQWSYLNKVDLILNSFEAEPVNGDNENLFVMSDGNIRAYKVSLEFTTVQKLGMEKQRSSVESRINDVLEGDK